MFSALFNSIEDLRMIASVEDDSEVRDLAYRMKESVMHKDSYFQVEEGHVN